MGLADDISSAIHKQLDCHVAWLPVTNTFKLGDYGVFSNGVFSRLGNISEFKVQFGESPGPSSKLSFTSAEAKTVNFSAGAQVDIIPDGAIDAKIKIAFSRAGSFLMKSDLVTSLEMQDVAAALNKAAQSKSWRLRYKVVTKLFIAEHFTLLASRADNTEVTVAGEAPALKKFSIGSAELGLRVAANKELGLELVGEKGVIGLGLARRRIAGGISVLAEEKAEFETVPTADSLPESDL